MQQHYIWAAAFHAIDYADRLLQYWPSCAFHNVFAHSVLIEFSVGSYV